MLQNFNARTVDATFPNDMVDKPFAASGFIDMQTEIWKDVVGYEGYYQVSNLGNVRSLKRYANKRWYGGRLLKPVDRGQKYLCVDLSVNCKSKLIDIQILVATAFIPNPLNLPQVNHINGIKTDNRVENLEWSDASMQAMHAFKLGLRKPTRGFGDPKSKTVYQYDFDMNLVNTWGSTMDAERAGYCSITISAVCRGYRSHKTHKGYFWSYKKLHEQNT